MGKLGIVFVIASIITFVYVIRTIRKHGLNIDDSIVWIIWSFILLVVSILPQIPTFVSKSLGFISTSNFIFCLFIFFLYIVAFFQAIQISKLKQKQLDLIQRLSIKQYEEEKKNKE